MNQQTESGKVETEHSLFSKINTNYRSASANSLAAGPYNHEPCSKTLNKFHDSVNHSLVNVTYRSNAHKLNHPVIVAKQKFKYMYNQKSFIDETLFGFEKLITSSKSERTAETSPLDIYQNTRYHVSHNLMSNVIPLMHAPRPASSCHVSTVRPDSARKENVHKINRNMHAIVPPRPWKP
jgi:hypothetical protein